MHHQNNVHYNELKAMKTQIQIDYLSDATHELSGFNYDELRC
jgi:hypothetical protein